MMEKKEMTALWLAQFEKLANWYFSSWIFESLEVNASTV